MALLCAVSALVAVNPRAVSAFEVAEYLQCSLCDELSGQIDDCCCDVETVDTTNDEHFLPILQELTSTTFFKYFKVDLWRECPFWQEDGMCMARDCAVCECDPNEVPQQIIDTDTAEGDSSGTGGAVAGENTQASCDEESGGHELAKVTLGGATAGETFNEWSLGRSAELEADTDDQEILPWTVQDEDSPGMTYINLVDNPERDTKYTGSNTRRVWGSIYKENCFDGPFDGLCLEERVFQRIISGIQGSISSHIAAQYSQGDGSFGPNLDLYLRMMGRHPDRLKNLYFTYLFVMRAVAKAKPTLERLHIDTGVPEDDERTRRLLASLTSTEVPAVLRGFDESSMFKVKTEDFVAECPPVLHGLEDLHDLQHRFVDEAAKKAKLKDSFRAKFHNISRIMDCVGCEKCRMWGKLEFLGVGTAMKILFDDDAAHGPNVRLTRNEIIALITTVKQLAESLSYIPLMRDLEAERAQMRLMAGAGAAVLGVIVIVFVFRKTGLVLRRRRASSAGDGDKEGEQKESRTASNGVDKKNE